MGIECRVAKIRLIAILAFEVATVDVIFGPALGLALIALGARTVLRVVVFIVLIRIRIVLRLTAFSSLMSWASLNSTHIWGTLGHASWMYTSEIGTSKSTLLEILSAQFRQVVPVWGLALRSL